MANETKHSPEPWAEDAVGFGVRDATGRDIWLIDDIDPEDRRRIVACVNACAGLSTEALEAGHLAKALEAAKRATTWGEAWAEGDEVTEEEARALVDLTVALRELGVLR